MRVLRFKYMEMHEVEHFLTEMFEVLYSNMNLIAPTNNSYESDYQIWVSHIVPALKVEYRKTILLYTDDHFAGYLRYYLNNSEQSFLIEDIQIKSEFQGIGLFSSCLRWLVKQLPKNVLYVQAYVDKRNVKSHAIMEHYGLRSIGENKNGISLCLQCDYTAFYNNLFRI